MTNGNPVKVTSTKEKAKKDIKPKKKLVQVFNLEGEIAMRERIRDTIFIVLYFRTISFDVTEVTNNNYSSKKIKTTPVRKVTRRCNGKYHFVVSFLGHVACFSGFLIDVFCRLEKFQ